MKIIQLGERQSEELGKMFLGIAQALFVGSVGAFFIPSLAGRNVSIVVFVFGLCGTLTFIIFGLILLREKRRK